MKAKTVAFSLTSAKSIPIPTMPNGKEYEIIGRHVHVTLFDCARVLSNVVTLAAHIQPDGSWKFSPKASSRYPILNT